MDGRLFERAIAEGMLYIPGECCYPEHGCPRRKNTLRLSFGVPTSEEIARGVESLARAIDRYCESGHRPIAVMRIIDRYLLRQFLQTFMICYLSLTGVYVIFDAFSNFDAFLKIAKGVQLLKVIGPITPTNRSFFRSIE